MGVTDLLMQGWRDTEVIQPAGLEGGVAIAYTPDNIVRWAEDTVMEGRGDTTEPIHGDTW